MVASIISMVVIVISCPVGKCWIRLAGRLVAVGVGGIGVGGTSVGVSVEGRLVAEGDTA